MIKIELSHVRQNDEFAVCLTRAPEMPGIAGPPVHIKFGGNLSVVAANDDDNGWSWCHLEKDEKDAIGAKLLEIDAQLDEWYFCLMYKPEKAEDRG